MLGYISPITTSLPQIYRRILVQPISLNPRTRLDFKHHPTQEYFRQFTIIWDLCRFLQPGQISSTIFYKKLDFPTISHNRYIKLHWAHFLMIANTYLELKLLTNPLYKLSAITTKSLIKSLKDFQNSLIKKFTLPF